MSAPARPPARVYIATAGVFLGAGIVSLFGRLLTVGLPDIRGTLGLGFDEASWIPTVYNSALMFMGPFSVFLGALLGPRRVLLTTGTIFFVTSLLVPFSPNLTTMLALQLVGGLASGTFYPLSLSFALRSLPPHLVVYAIGGYSMELLSTLSIGTALEGWFAQHGSWHWIFWINCVLVVLMMLMVYIGMPAAPPPAGAKSKASWRGFLLVSLGFASFFAALDQGERLNWLDSGTIVALLVVGGLFIVMGAVEQWRRPNPLVKLDFLLRRNTLILGYGLFSMRFVLLGILVVIPGYLGAVQGFRPEQTGAILLDLAGPLIVSGFIFVQLVRRIENRLVPALAFTGVAAACLLDTRLTSDWARPEFLAPQILMAVALAGAFVGQISLVAQNAIESGATSNPVNILTYAAFLQWMRLFGGQVGVTLVQHFIVVRSRFHASILGATVQAGSALTDEHLRALQGRFASGVSSTDALQARVLSSVGGEVAKQVATLSYLDAFKLIAGVCAAMVVLYACVKPMKMHFSAKAARAARAAAAAAR